MSPRERSDRTAAADALCVAAFEKTGAPVTGLSLVAVGGYGRGELAPYSDLDVVLVHADDVDPGEAAEQVWYPLWDSGSRLDHSVRSLSEMVSTAGQDLKVALGLLDARHLAGDAHLTLQLRTTMLTHWRREARDRLPELRDLVRARHELLGELAHLSVPDLKEAAGGLRDATVLKALVATWLVDVPHGELERRRLALLDVRDVLHGVTGRATDRVAPEHWADLAPGLGLDGEAAAQVHVRDLGRAITHLSRLTWRRVESVLARPTSPRHARTPALTRLAPGVALSRGEVVLEADARPDRDPLLLLRAAVEAAERDVVLAPPTAARLAREAAPLPDPWPPEARHLLVRLLASGRGLLAVWETLEETGAVARALPEWDRIRTLPHASPIHRFTVDRHVVETCIEAASLIRDVGRPDVLMVAALLHDIGKGGLTEHSVAGEPIARAVATRMGFEPEDVERIARLVRWHLLLAETATTRDPEDPATVALVTDCLVDPETVTLLLALSEADARATAPKAWSTWRAGLVTDLARRVLAAMDVDAPAVDPQPDLPVPAAVRAGGFDLQVEADGDGARVTVLAPDRVGLLADVAAMFALQRASVRAARAWAQDDYAISVWDVADQLVDPAVLRQRFEAVVAGRIDPTSRLRPADTAGLAPTVGVRPEASRGATVLEVRAADRPGVLYLTLAALASLDVMVRSAHVDTLGPQAVDVFYVQEDGAGALSEPRAAEAAHAVRAVLGGDLSVLTPPDHE
ncbi:[protein-PII] uridylyltransferase [Nocardioides euryhalodurans]|uniref:[protein-PII] uridylyltransferase n=1 Tax=Nocardioides euryhalodurans TaxID=2518370 RepID=UPI001421A14C|nr:[protein-PII] uridylyltransferase [Nocardioides euryhalodurans]